MKKTTLYFLLTLSTLSASATIYNVSASLNGSNVVPPQDIPYTGTLTGTFNDVTGVLNFTITSTLSYDPIFPHTYEFFTGPAGANGSLINSYSEPPPFSGSITLSNTALLNGNIYVQIDREPEKIRGQLLATTIQTFTSATMNDFLGIGGYSFTQNSFPTGVQPTPYVVSGPSPQNDFSFSVMAAGGLNNEFGSITAYTANTPITIQFNNNNIRKFACQPFGLNGFVNTNDVITLTATTNLGNTATQTGSNAQFVGFNVIGNENEYLVSVTAQFQTSPSPVARISLSNVIFGDNTPQNVSLNFDGLDDFVSIPSNVGNFNYNQAFTVSCWVKPAIAQLDLGNSDNDILEKWNQSGSYPFVIRYLNYQVGSTDAAKIRVARYDGTNAPSITSNNHINDGKWHHIALTTTGGNGGTMNLYIDGVQQGTGVTDNTNATTTNNSPLFVGQRGNGINRFRGEIDEIRIWTVAKSTTEIANEMFCKNPNTVNLQAAYNFNNGVPNGNNTLITQVQDAVGSNHGTLSGFAKTGDGSNWVTGQVKYVKANATGSNNGSDWTNAFTNLQTALASTPCNDLFDVYVATGTYKPHANDTFIPFAIPAGMKIYGGFAGTEKNSNERNMALIHTTNKTTLSGDFENNDTPFNFATNRTDNSQYVVVISSGNVTFDGFTVRGGQIWGMYKDPHGNIKIRNCRMVDNANGLYLQDANSTVSNCLVAGNNNDGIFMLDNSTNFSNCLIVNNGRHGIFQNLAGIINTNIINSTIAANGGNGIFSASFMGGGPYTNNIKNTIIKNNGAGIVNGGAGITNNNITYSLVQDVFTGSGNLNGNTVNPQFVSPLANTVKSDLGDYRLKWCSLGIGAGNNLGINPLDLDRKPRNFGGIADMGAYEFLGNTPSPTNAPNSSITGTIDSPTYAGGAIQTITSNAKILAPAEAIDFKAPNAIILNPGFEARGVGQYFKAQIGANVGCSN